MYTDDLYVSLEGGNWRVMSADENGAYTVADMCCDDQAENAALFAAAPKLLAALQELRYACTQKAEKMADEAIAMALGVPSDASNRTPRANLTNVLGMPAFEYEGRMYVRCCERGTVLEDLPSQDGIEQALAEGEYHVEIRAWRKDELPIQPTTLDEMREILSTPNDRGERGER